MALPIAAIVCIVLACWVLLVLILFAVYQLLKSRGSCKCECAPCGKEGSGGCCECCISLSDSCNCCNPSVNGCLDKICPGKKKVSCVDLLLCQCCASEGEQSCCLKILPSCGCCSCYHDDTDCCSCCADCEGIVCCCLEIRLVSSKPASNTTATSARKYTTESSKSNTTNLDPVDKQIVKRGAVKEKVNSDSSQKDSARSLPNSPPSSARSTSHLILLPKKETGNKKKVPKRMVKSQSVDLPSRSAASKSKTNSLQAGQKKIQRRSLPGKPKAAAKQSHKSKQTESESESTSGSSNESELMEVAIKQQNIPIHTVNSSSVARAMSLGSLNSGSHVSFALSDIGDSQVSVDSQSAVNYALSSSDVLHSAYDGFSSHRQYGAESQVFYNINYSETVNGFSQQSKKTSSGRPLPMPSSR